MPKVQAPDYESDLAIDQYSLDSEWLDQPLMFMRYAALSREAHLEATAADERMRVLRSQLILDVARNGIPEIEKVTESKIEAWVTTQKSMIDAKLEVAEANHIASLLDAAVQAMRQRRDALENLVRLSLGEYYSSPSAPQPKDLKNRHKIAEEVDNNEVSSKMQQAANNRSKRTAAKTK